MENLQEKRRHQRFVFQKPVQINPVLSSKSGYIYEVQDLIIPSISHNISEGGLKLETPKRLDADAILKLGFELEKGGNVEVYAKIIWVQKNHCGVQFLAPITLIQKVVRNFSRKT